MNLTFKKRISACAERFAAFAPAWLIAILLVRCMEYITLAAWGTLPPEFATVLAFGALSDLATFLKSLPVYFLLFALLFWFTWFRETHRRWFGLLGTIAIAAHIALIQFFATALVPLGSDLFGYSPSYIRAVLQTGSTMDSIAIFGFAVPIIGFWIALFLLGRTDRSLRTAAGLLAAGFVCLAVPSEPPARLFESDYSRAVAENKGSHFISGALAYFVSGSREKESGSFLEDVSANDLPGRAQFRYANEDFPFLRAEETPDVLGEFFNIDPTRPPNIIILQVEGLGRAFSGPHAYLGSFTPFLDDLTKKSLYWDNFLATQGRTFAALPSILGSLPFGEKGFNDLGEGMPKHFSLVNILKKNGYRTRFLGGFDLNYDNQRAYMAMQGTDLMIGIEDFDSSFTLSPSATSGVNTASWGYADGELITKTLQVHADTAEPFFTFVQLMSMHTPYIVPHHDLFLSLFQKHLETLDLDRENQEKRIAYKDIYATILYTDHAIRRFFDSYSKHPAYSNTIFIITGDHRLPEIPISTKIDRYHVPMIIFSPLLKHPARFKSISSHFDITPSLVALLKNRYGLSAPATVAWVGSGLDIEPSLRNIHGIPIKQAITLLHNFASGLYFIDQDRLFKIGNKMDLEPIEDPERLEKLQGEFEMYRARNRRFMKDARLMPDAIYSGYFEENRDL